MSAVNRDVKKEDNIILTKALWNSVKKLDAIYRSGKNGKTIFSYEAYGHRLRLKETLQKLMFMDCALNGRRSEELIWRKSFYEPIFMYKMNMKNNTMTENSDTLELSVKTHLLSAIGYYQSLLLMLQAEVFDNSEIDFYSWIPIFYHIPLYNNRYLIDFGEYEARRVAHLYYRAACNFDSAVGLPHNQLAILDVGRCYGLNSVYHYLRCLTSEVPFEGANRNLITALTKNEVRFYKMMRDKSIRRSNYRSPAFFRPKEFRKTIMKFMFLVHQFLKPKDKPKHSSLANIFDDTLTELDCTLCITDHLTIDSDGVELTTSHLFASRSVAHVCDQFTGPILVRILLITILVVVKTESDVGDEQSDIKLTKCTLMDSVWDNLHAIWLGLCLGSNGYVVGPTYSCMLPNELNSGKELQGMICKLGINKENTQMDEDTQSPTFDRHGPLVFLLNLGSIFLFHLCRQIYSNLGELSEGKSAMSNEHLEDDVEILQVIDQKSETDVCLKDNGVCGDEKEEEIVSSGGASVDEEGDLPQFLRRDVSSSDGSFGRDRGNPSEEDDESDSDFWASDGSSLLHSQDEETSSIVSSNDEKRGNCATSFAKSDSNIRSKSLTQVLKENYLKKSKRRHAIDSGDDDDGFAYRNNCVKNSQIGRNKGKTSNEVEDETDGDRDCTNSSADELSHSLKHKSLHTSKSVCYSNRASKLEKDRSTPDGKVDHTSRQAQLNRLNLISRLYLLGPIKLFANWLEASNKSGLLNQHSEHSNDPDLVGNVVSHFVYLANQLYPILHLLDKRDDEDNFEFYAKSFVSPSAWNSATNLLNQMKDLQSSNQMSDLHSANETLEEKLSNPTSDENIQSKISSLPEDWLLRGLPCLQSVHKQIDFGRLFVQQSSSILDDALVRCSSLVLFTTKLANSNSNDFHFDPINTRQFAFDPCVTYQMLLDKHYLALPDNSSGQRSDYPTDRTSNRRRNRRERYLTKKVCVARNYAQQEKSDHAIYCNNNSNIANLSTLRYDACQNRSIKDEPFELDDADGICGSSGPQEDDAVTGKNADQTRQDRAMRNMARLRLLNEVNELTRQFGRQSAVDDLSNADSAGTDIKMTTKLHFLSPFLVLDAYCVANHLAMVKRLIQSGRFIMIVPQAVIAHLDYMKKTMASSRVAIRYLEQAATDGNRYLRLQKSNEQPDHPIELNRLNSTLDTDDTKVNENDAVEVDGLANVDDTSASSSHPIKHANPRIIRRWLSILDCASYFVKNLGKSENSAYLNPEESSDHFVCTDNGIYCDLLLTQRESSDLDLDRQTSSVTVLIGSRNTNPEDYIVPQHFLTLASNHGVRFELIKNFINKWQNQK